MRLTAINPRALPIVDHQLAGSYPLQCHDIDDLLVLSEYVEKERFDLSEGASSRLSQGTFINSNYRRGDETFSFQCPKVALPVLNKVLSPTMQDFLKSCLGMTSALRCGVASFNDYLPGDYMQAHYDRVVFDGLQVALIICLEGDKDGGGAIRTRDQGVDRDITLSRGDMLLLSGSVLHEVLPIKNHRKTLVLFLGE